MPTRKPPARRRPRPADPALTPGPTQTPVPWARDELVYEAAAGASPAVVPAHNAGGPRLSPQAAACLSRGMTMTLEEYRRCR